MIVEEIMQTHIVTVFPESPIFEAHQKMLQHNIRHLPIVNEQHQLIGIVSDRDIRDALPSILNHSNEQPLHILETPIKTIMKTNVITGHPLDFVEEVGSIFYEHHISCLPIIHEEKLVGIITKTDLLHSLIQLTGAHQPGSQIEVKVPNRTGVLYELTKVFHDRKTKILSILIYPDKKDDRFKIVVIRVQTINPVNLLIDLKNTGYEVLWPNVPGITR